MVGNGKTIATTLRLRLREASLDDAEFFLDLLNESGWKKFIANHDIDSINKAKSYIQDKILRMYKEHGVGLWVMELASNSIPIGICGLLKRPELEQLDLGFALLEKFWHQGYVQEASAAVIDMAFKQFGCAKITAITNFTSSPSIRVLEQLGFKYYGTHQQENDRPLALYEFLRADF